MQLGEKIYHYRNKAGMTQEQLADALSVSRQSISKWESGASKPEISKLVALCELFHITMDELLREEMDETSTVEKEEPSDKEADQTQLLELTEKIASLKKAGVMGIVVIVILFCGLLFLFIKYHDLKQEVSQLHNTPQYVYTDNGEETADPIYQVFQEVKHTVTDYRKEDDTVEVMLSVLPIKQEKDASLEAVLETTEGERYSVTLEEQQEYYVGNTRLPFTANVEQIIYRITNEKETQNVTDDGFLVLSEIDIDPTVVLSTGNVKAIFGSSKSTVEAEISVVCNQPDFISDIEEAHYELRRNGKIEDQGAVNLPDSGEESVITNVKMKTSLTSGTYEFAICYHNKKLDKDIALTTELDFVAGQQVTMEHGEEACTYGVRE